MIAFTANDGSLVKLADTDERIPVRYNCKTQERVRWVDEQGNPWVRLDGRYWQVESHGAFWALPAHPRQRWQTDAKRFRR